MDQKKIALLNGTMNVFQTLQDEPATVALKSRMVDIRDKNILDQRLQTIDQNREDE